MKLKYYMRGLGIGIILTTLILTIGRTKEKLSDAEIKDRAAALGMVMKEQSNPGLEDLLEEMKPTGLVGMDQAEDQTKLEDSQGSKEVQEGSNDNSTDLQQGDADPQQGAADLQQGAANPQQGAADLQQGDADSQQGDTNTEGDDTSDTQEFPLPTPPAQETAIKPTEIPTQTDPQENSAEITFRVEKGMSSGKVAALLQEKGLVENADEFNAYIVEKGKASVIRIGTYSLPEGASFEDIINAITVSP